MSRALNKATTLCAEGIAEKGSGDFTPEFPVAAPVTSALSVEARSFAPQEHRPLRCFDQTFISSARICAGTALNALDAVLSSFLFASSRLGSIMRKCRTTSATLPTTEMNDGKAFDSVGESRCFSDGRSGSAAPVRSLDQQTYGRPLMSAGIAGR